MGRYWCVTELDIYGETPVGEWGYCVQAPDFEMDTEAIVFCVLCAFLLLGFIALLGFRVRLCIEEMKAKREYQKNPWTESQGDLPDLENRDLSIEGLGSGFLKALTSWKRKSQKSQETADASSFEGHCDDLAEAPASRIGSTSS